MGYNLPGAYNTNLAVPFFTWLIDNGRMYGMQDLQNTGDTTEYLIMAPSDRSVHLYTTVTITEGGDVSLYDTVNNITDNGTVKNALNLNNNYGKNYTTKIYMNPTYSSVADLEWAHVAPANAKSESSAQTNFPRVMSPGDNFLLRIVPGGIGKFTIQIDFYESDNHIRANG